MKEEEEEGRGEELCTVQMPAHAKRLCVRDCSRVCVHMVYHRNQNRAASRPADLQRQPEEESEQRDSEKTETSGTGITSVTQEGGNTLKASTSTYSL